MFANADIQSGLSKSDVELGCLDPLPEICPRRLLQFGGISALEGPERDEVVLVIVGGEALHEGLVGDMVLAPGALAAGAFDRQPTSASMMSSCDGQLPPFAFIAFSTAAL